MMKWGVVFGVGLLVVLAGGWLWMGQNKSSTQMEAKPGVGETVGIVAPTTEVVEEVVGDVREFEVGASNFKFVPAVITVKKGERVRVTLKSAGGVHDWVLDGYGVKTNQIGDGEEEEVEFVADKVGTFEYYCSVGQHRKMGMVGKLIVE